MDISKLSEPLSMDQIEFRVQSINDYNKATILAYKDARVDQQRLDDVCGPLNWERKHTRDNKNCIVSIWDEDKKQWISKEDTGTESNAEAQKGLASDSFKRACFNWGIGRELYDYPRIQIQLTDEEVNVKNGRRYASWKLKLSEWKWYAEFEGARLTFLAAKDTRNQVRFKWGEMKKPQAKLRSKSGADEGDRESIY